MNRTRLSLYYLASYLLPAGVMLFVAPDLALKLLQSNGSYGDIMPRVAGGAFIALGVLVVQIIRHRVEVLYTTTLGVRVFLLSALLWLYSRSADPFFLIVSGIVALGMALTTSAYLLDSRGRAATASP
jgi:uncharacterized protein YjeT (DUF2065 family)